MPAAETNLHAVFGPQLETEGWTLELIDQGDDFYLTRVHTPRGLVIANIPRSSVAAIVSTRRR